jgi:hypothetical protein
LGLTQPGRPGPHIYIPQEQGDSIIPPGTDCFSSHSYVKTDSQPVCLGVTVRQLRVVHVEHPL